MKEEVNMNFWFQHDNFFLLSESAAYNAQFFGIFADTEVLDKLVGKFKSDTMNYTKQQKVDIDSSLKIRKQLDKLSTVDILRTQVVLLEKQALQVQSLKDKIKRYITITEQRQTNLKNLKIIKVYLLKYYKAYYSISTLKNQMLKLKSKYLKKDILDNYSRLHSLIQNKAWELHSKLLNKNRINLLGERLLTTRGIVGDINNMCNLRLELLRSNKEFTGLSLKHQRYIKIVDRENILAAASTKVKILKVLKLKRDLDNQTNTLILKQDKSILITNFEENLKSLNTVKETIKKLKVAAVDLMMATQNKDRNTAILKNHKDTQNLYETKLQDFKKEFSICPLCGTHLEGGLK